MTNYHRLNGKTPSQTLREIKIYKESIHPKMDPSLTEIQDGLNNYKKY